ncbi:hypothetical protein POM88_033246 [Heracleum sosnowskyi]|uniref:Enolpyruvate transferase domain-containing protein n=1 Tax=Heracleum sosnowskyi TaxID=360622 RepID=A0AAD8I370_9APIA|nr:hypothetical protein POM88_033246 [Heracleum sosnowskyi]
MCKVYYLLRVSDRVSVGRALDLLVYFGDAGSRERCKLRTVSALNKYFPNLKTFVRAHDADHGINLEKAGATAEGTKEKKVEETDSVMRNDNPSGKESTDETQLFLGNSGTAMHPLSAAVTVAGGNSRVGFSQLVGDYKVEEEDSASKRAIIEGSSGLFPAGKEFKDEIQLFLGNAGTTMRPLTAAVIVAGGNYSYILDGVPRMREANCPIAGKGGLPGGKVKLSGSVSSQYLTALLMAAPLAVGDI